ncbi:aldo-keto reductase family 1 member C15-like isoform X2 [Ochotona princeps]|uniref:aldo-keto reductase family 1 member C15-like isoform X2 n=1 Tax=Ochotona princeps TaxID=9978 RepID=UPI002714E563|nr:aldo-keto reductase family 1 member C15-like isoform X2 [Ochotona princeps]
MDLKHSRSVKLNDGHLMPRLGFGTAASGDVPKSKSYEFTKVAIDAGFRHFDSAFIYGNEEQVGEAIREKIADGTVKREDVFYTTKLWATHFRPEFVRPALEKSLKKLQMDYVDLIIIHLPVPMKPGDELIPMDDKGQFILDTVDLRDTWEVECHVYLNQSKLLEYCKSKDIALVAYSALGSQRDPSWVDQNSPVLLEDPVLKAIAKKRNRTPGQVALRYLLQRGVVVLAKSFNEKRIKENMQIFEFELTAEDMKDIDGINKNLRYTTLQYAANHPNYPFNEEY